MWRTNNGDRILKGAEAELFAEILFDFIDEVNLSDENDYEVGVAVFDRLTYGQKISVLTTIAIGLFKPEVICNKLSAVNEGAIAAVFEHLKNCIIIETDEPEFGSSWRQKVWEVRKFVGGENLPDVTCEYPEEWEIEVDALADLILWDADYGDEDLYIDRPPEDAQILQEFVRIPKEYYLDIPDDPKPKEIEQRLNELRKHCRSICPKSFFSQN